MIMVVSLRLLYPIVDQLLSWPTMLGRYQRIQGELLKLDHRVSASTIRSRLNRYYGRLQRPPGTPPTSGLLTARTELTDRSLIFSERHLRTVSGSRTRP